MGCFLTIPTSTGMAAATVLPWTVRNLAVTGDFIPVETNGVYNLYDDNTLVEGDRRARQDATIAAQPTLAAQRSLALRLAMRGIARHPGAFAEKAWRNLLHFLRRRVLEESLVEQDLAGLAVHADREHLAAILSGGGHPNLPAPNDRRGPAAVVNRRLPTHILRLAERHGQPGSRAVPIVLAWLELRDRSRSGEVSSQVAGADSYRRTS